MRTIKHNQKVIEKLRKQLVSIQEKQKENQKKIHAALGKAGKHSGKSAQHIHMRLKKNRDPS